MSRLKFFGLFASCFRASQQPKEESLEPAKTVDDTMAKRKIDASQPEIIRGPKRKKAAAEDDDGPFSSTQKSAISEFTQVTQSDKNTAQKFLKQHNWNVGQAVNSFFSASNGAPNPLRGSIDKLFDKYRDDPRNEPNEINVEGTQKIFSDMNIALDDIGAFVFSELVDSPSLGKITREGFMNGCLDVNADTVAKIRNVVLQRTSTLSTDRPTLRNVYNHAFQLGLANNQKSLTPEAATEFWSVLFSKSGFEWRTAKTPWLDWWLEFQEKKWKKAVNKDLWKQTLTFAEETVKDETLGFWSEEASWPSVLDDFVEWVRVEKGRGGGGAGGGGDDMEVE